MVTIEPANVRAADETTPPTMYEARRVYLPEDVPEVPSNEIPAAVRRELEALKGRVHPGARVAIATGSRGIANHAAIVKACGEAVRAAGGHPFIMPAMGSHGGATAEGQRDVLLGYGITPAAMGMDIVSDMSVRQIGALPSGLPIYVSVTALESDQVLLVHRIKPHTDFRGPIESGLAKICAIGLGKQRGAETIHHVGLKGLTQYMVQVARHIIENTGKIVGGLGILENALDRTASVHWVPPEDIGGPGEAVLQARSKTLLAVLPFDDLDVLIVDEMGKDVSGTGMDTNVVGRVCVAKAPQFDRPQIAIVAVLDLTEETRGNASGLGVADVTTVRLLEKVDWHKTWMNGYTSGLTGVQRSRIPMVFPDDREAIAAAIQMSGETDPARVRLVRIKNTLEVARMQISAGLLAEAAEKGLSVEPEGKPFDFDAVNHLVTPAPRAAIPSR